MIGRSGSQSILQARSLIANTAAIGPGTTPVMGIVEKTVFHIIYFVMWADEVTIAQNIFNRLVGFWISR